LSHRYNPELGDVVVGRVTEVTLLCASQSSISTSKLKL